NWTIDADEHNMGWIPYGAGNTGNESNPYNIPIPAQFTIDSSTPETYWSGGLSAWAIDCVNQGYTVETLPYYRSITYNEANFDDLSNYKVFVVCEPNILFTASEKT